MRKVINGICVALGFVVLGIGIIGIVLPLLPTTPLLLLAAALFAKGSERFHVWFTHTGIYRKYINQAIHKKELTRMGKVKILIPILLLLGFGFVMSPVWYAKAIIGVIIIGHMYFFLCRVKTVETVIYSSEADQYEIAED